MNLGTWLDTAIGVALFFLAMSFAVSTVVEALSQLLAWRANTLREGVANLLASVGLDANATPADAQRPGNALTMFYEHSLIRGLFDRRSAQRPRFYTNLLNGKAPSYVPSATFANVFLDLVTRNGAHRQLAAAMRSAADRLREAREAAAGPGRAAALTRLRESPAAIDIAVRRAIAEAPRLLERQKRDAADRLGAVVERHAEALAVGDTARAARLEVERRLVETECVRLAGALATDIAALADSAQAAAMTAAIGKLRDAIEAPEAAGDAESWRLRLSAVDLALADVTARTNRIEALLSAAGSAIDRSIVDARGVVERIENAEVRNALGAMLGDAQASVDQLRATVAKWFDDSMDRVGGWYKRRTQLAGFAVGFFVAVAINADAINVVRTIAADQTLRQELVALAQSVEALEKQADRVRTLRDELKRLPIGWYKASCGQTPPMKTCNEPATWSDFPANLEFWPLSILGWLITALAVKLGAPFWFDLMSKLLKVRATGIIPVKAAPSGGGK